jgi:predicted MFS family arabinose efflux permease
MYTYLGAGLSDLGYAPQQIAEVVFIYGIAACIGALIGGRVADRLGPYVAVRVSLAALCVAFAVLQLSTRLGPFIGVAVALTSLAAQTFFPAQQALLISAFNERSPAALSWNNSALFLGMTLGSLLGGQVLGAGGFTAIPTMSVGLTLVGLLACSRSTCAVGTIATEPGLLRT